MNKKTKQKKVDDAEDWCFVCKDGGNLLICDHQDCLKVYHPRCVGLKNSVLKSSASCWTCSRHSCFICHKTPEFDCLCCPRAICGLCISTAAFAFVKGKSGLCSTCLKLAIRVEEKAKFNHDGKKMDLEDRNTYECRYKEYLEIIMGQEGLILGDIRRAMHELESDESQSCSSDSVEIVKRKEDGVITISDGDADVEINKPMGKRKTFTEKENSGWGSSPLIEFLRSIGEDTTKKFSRYEVNSIISKYIVKKNLIQQRKKVVRCDQKLYSIFKKKSVPKNKIYSLLKAHFAENSEHLNEHDNEYDNESSSENKTGTVLVACKKQRAINSGLTSQGGKVSCGVQKSPFASLIVDNIKLVYLRKCLVEKLLTQPEDFEDKVVGSFVKVKKDPGDMSRRVSYQLLQVIGIKKTSSGNTDKRILLQVPYMPMDIGLSMLSDDDFSEEECQDLQLKVKNGLLKKPTVVELEQKARSLHEDITKHWIERELVRLQNLVDFANEKGWRREVDKYLDQKELLKQPHEQQRLLQKLPTVIADDVEAEPSIVDTLDGDKSTHADDTNGGDSENNQQ